jgi:hypothetical protein
MGIARRRLRFPSPRAGAVAKAMAQGVAGRRDTPSRSRDGDPGQGWGLVRRKRFSYSSGSPKDRKTDGRRWPAEEGSRGMGAQWMGVLRIAFHSPDAHHINDSGSRALRIICSLPYAIAVIRKLQFAYNLLDCDAPSSTGNANDICRVARTLRDGSVERSVPARRRIHIQDDQRTALLVFPRADRQRTDAYAGPETPELLERIAHHKEARDDERERRALVSTLVRSFGLPRPFPRSQM